MRCLIDGKIKQLDKLALDTGYFYGYGVFETILIREGVPIFLKAHLDRLNKSLESINIQKKVEKADVDYAISAFRCHNTALKINVSEKHVIMSLRSVPYTGEHYKVGLKLMTTHVRKNPSSPLTYMKTMNYMDSIMCLKEAKDMGYNDALFLNHQLEVCETAIANIFIIKDDQIITPNKEVGLLEGVVRAWLIHEAEIIERPISLEEVLTCDGAFVTNSLLGIMKVTTINQTELKDHPKIHDLTRAYIVELKRQGEIYE